MMTVRFCSDHSINTRMLPVPCRDTVVVVLSWFLFILYILPSPQRSGGTTGGPAVRHTDQCLLQTGTTASTGQQPQCQVCAHRRPQWVFNTLRPRQNGRHFPDDIFKCIFFNESMWFFVEISLKFVPKGLINNIPELVQIMACRRPGDKPLSEPILVCLLTHICGTRPQCVNNLLWYQQSLSGIGSLNYKNKMVSWPCYLNDHNPSIPILVKQHFYIELANRLQTAWRSSAVS